MAGNLPFIYIYKPFARTQLEKATRIGKLRLGNAGSAFVEVLVGQSAWPPNTEYKVRLSSHAHHGQHDLHCSCPCRREGGRLSSHLSSCNLLGGQQGRTSICLSRARTEASIKLMRLE
jgi:hypothetical protein